ncbi:MAG: hypothetical protein FXF54_00605 [Kosmotoga sp.]|jgi:hypothetical protein|nr:MAG: hypothetical protein FXF54_00605 [Kosmotoga sp.]
MKKLLVGFLAVFLLFLVSGCFLINKPPIISLTGSVLNGEEIAPKTLVTFQWEVTDVDDKEIEVEFKLFKNGEEVLSVNNDTKATYAVDEQGKYVAKVIASDSKNESESEIAFKATNFKRELYQSGAGLVYIDQNDYFTYIEDEVFGIRFYKTASEEITESEDVTKRIRLNLLDTNQDGIYDTWEEIPNSRLDLHTYAYLPGSLVEYSTLWVPYAFEYSEDSIRAYYLGVDGPYTNYIFYYKLAEVGFELNTVYARWVDATVFGNSLDAYGAAYRAFALRERYDSGEKPVFSVQTETTNVATGSSFTVDITAENVSNFADLYDVRYMQISLWHTENIVLEDVEFTNFMPKLDDVESHNVATSTVCLYKAFLNGADETEEQSDVFASLTFSVPEDFEVEEIEVGLAYEGYWDTYESYPDLPNPAFRDIDNKVVDGFIVDHNPAVISVE